MCQQCKEERLVRSSEFCLSWQRLRISRKNSDVANRKPHPSSFLEVIACSLLPRSGLVLRHGTTRPQVAKKGDGFEWKVLSCQSGPVRCQ